MEHIRHKHTHKTCAHYTYTYQISRLGYNISDEFQNRTECLGESKQEGGSTRKRMKVRMRERKKGEKKCASESCKNESLRIYIAILPHIVGVIMLQLCCNLACSFF